MVTILQGDCIDVMKGLDEKSVNCCVTSPPYYGLRDYLPDVVCAKPDTPAKVFEELRGLGILPLDSTAV